MLRSAAAVMLFVAACGAPPLSHPMSPDGDAALILGSLGPDGGFLPLTEGQDATLVEGAQGGFHVWLKFRLRDPAAMHVNVLRRAHRLSDGQLVLRAMGTLDIGGPDAGGMWESPNPTPMFMCPSPIGIRVIDEAMVFEVSFSDEGGREVAHGSITLVPRCPDAQRDFCLRICTG